MPETQPNPMHIPLEEAYLCQDCNCIVNQSRRCPACASEVLMGLAGVLNREVQEEGLSSLGGVTAWQQS
jgi:hypothetical protein